MSGRCFLDSSFWICLRDEREPDHAVAREVTRRLLGQRTQLVISPLILAETQAYFCRSSLRTRQILDDFENNPVLHCEPMTPADQREAIALLRSHHDKATQHCRDRPLDAEQQTRYQRDACCGQKLPQQHRANGLAYARI